VKIPNYSPFGECLEKLIHTPVMMMMMRRRRIDEED
jgi:hypothetical protein